MLKSAFRLCWKKEESGKKEGRWRKGTPNRTDNFHSTPHPFDFGKCEERKEATRGKKKEEEEKGEGTPRKSVGLNPVSSVVHDAPTEERGKKGSWKKKKRRGG